MTQIIETCNDDERRGFFRIEDQIVLRYRILPSDQIPNRLDEVVLRETPFSLSASLELINHECRSLSARLEKKDPDVAEYLKLLDQKCSLIAQPVFAQAEEQEELDAQKVNISASGLAFECSSKMVEGDMLELSIVLPPSMVMIRVYGRVVYCIEQTDSPESPFRLGVDFAVIREKEREILIRHIVKRQLVDLRNKNTDE